MLKKILIIGGTGFIGYHLAKKSLKKKWIVHSLSSKKPRRKRYLSNVKYLICDITQKRKLENILKDSYDYVINLGGYVDHSNKLLTYKSHYLGCKNLAQFFLKKNIKSFIQAGSSSEYGRCRSPQDENTKCRPLSTYGKAKLSASLFLKKLFKKKKFPFTVLRFYQVYGPNQDYNRLIPFVIKSCLKNKKFPCSDGNQFRDFAYIDDIIEAIFKSLDSELSKGKIINIGSGKTYKIKNIIEYIKKKINGGNPMYGVIRLRKDEMIKIAPKLNLANKTVLKWKAKTSLRKGLDKTIFYFKKKLNIYN